MKQLGRQAKEQNSFASALPFIFRLTPSQPFSLEHYPMMRIFYDTRLPAKSLLRSGRQVSKSTNLAAKGLTKDICIPDYKQLYVLPLYEQTRRLSANYFKRFIENSPFRDAIIDSSCERNVLQKTISNGSMSIFTYALHDCDRARGIPADELNIDEVQDMNFEFLPILRECLSASRWQTENYAGTPKTLDNTICKLWGDSSQGEWAVPCEACGHWSIPSMGEDLMAMIGKKGLVCAKCGKPINTYLGQWVHKFPDRIWQFIGLHIPQIIVPMHCCDPVKWDKLLEKIEKGKRSTVLNEVLGEDCDVGAKMVTIEIIKRASKLPYRNTLEEAVAFSRKRGRYLMTSLGIDWGGRGEKGDSLTAFAVTGLRGNGITDVLYAMRLSMSATDDEEFQWARRLMQSFRCQGFGHDFRGVGLSKDARLKSEGYRAVTPWTFETGNASYFAKTTRGPDGRVFVRLNRSAAIQLLTFELRFMRYQLPRWEEDSMRNPFLDLNSWFEDTMVREDGRNIYRIMRSVAQPDDVGMAIIYSSFTNFRTINRWPNYMKTLTSKGIITDPNFNNPGAGEALD
ncbi:MAG: phage terminase large subunit family protein [Acholeplasmataceae bacterium]